MLPHLESLGVTRYILESREGSQDKSDVALLLSLCAKRMCREIEIEHLRGSSDSRLWVPDQVLGAYGDMRCGVGNGNEFRDAWNTLSPSVRTMEIML